MKLANPQLINVFSYAAVTVFLCLSDEHESPSLRMKVVLALVRMRGVNQRGGEPELRAQNVNPRTHNLNPRTYILRFYLKYGFEGSNLVQLLLGCRTVPLDDPHQIKTFGHFLDCLVTTSLTTLQ